MTINVKPFPKIEIISSSTREMFKFFHIFWQSFQTYTGSFSQPAWRWVDRYFFRCQCRISVLSLKSLGVQRPLFRRYKAMTNELSITGNRKTVRKFEKFLIARLDFYNIQQILVEHLNCEGNYPPQCNLFCLRSR